LGQFFLTLKREKFKGPRPNELEREPTTGTYYDKYKQTDFMKHAIFFPLYYIHSDLVKTAIGLKDSRSVEQFFHEAGIKIHEVGKKKCVTCEDLLSVTKAKQVIFRYEAKSALSKQFDQLE
jgi:hypothetical protein